MVISKFPNKNKFVELIFLFPVDIKNKIKHYTVFAQASTNYIKQKNCKILIKTNYYFNYQIILFVLHLVMVYII